MADPLTRESFAELVAMYLDEALDKAGTERMLAALSDSHEFRDLFVEMCTHSHLIAEPLASAPKQQSAVTRPSSAKVPGSAPARSSFGWPAISLAAAVLIAGGAVALYLMVSGGDPPADEPEYGPPVGHIVWTEQTIYTNDALSSGDSIPSGSITFPGGTSDLMLDSGTQVSVTGKSELRLVDPMRVAMTRGKAEFTVPARAVGFTVTLPDGSKVVDLGTRFSIDIDDDGRSRVVVLQGRIRVVTAAGDHELAGGQRAEVVGGQANVTAASQDDILLADLIAGGDGRLEPGESNPTRGIHPTTGEVVDDREALQINLTSTGFHSVSHTEFIDGVFVVTRGEEPMQIDSTGRTFAGFGEANGSTWGAFWSGGEGNHIPAKLGEVDYRSEGHTVIGFNRNKGITIDLDALRQRHGVRIVRFTAVVGNTIQKHDGESGRFHVIVDGESRLQLDSIPADHAAHPIDVAISDEDHFLTLAAPATLSWVMLGDPILQVAAATDDPNTSIDSHGNPSRVKTRSESASPPDATQ